MEPNRFEIILAVMRRVLPGTPEADYKFAYPFEPGHDQIWSSLSAELVPEDSEDGKLLTEAGWFIADEDDNWSCFT